MSRPRLLDRVRATVSGRSARVVVVGPPGSGKTVLLRQAEAASRAEGEVVAWYTADRTDRTAEVVLAAIGTVLARATGARPRWVQNPRDLVDLLADQARPVTLVVDDAHLLTGSAVEVVPRLADLLPPYARLAVAGRQEAPGWARLHLSGPVVRLDADDLRFQLSEVEELVALDGDETALLAQRTEGWAAGLRLFQLGTASWRPEDRRRLLDGAWHSLPLLRQYFTANVLDELSAEERDFLVGTSVLPWLCAPWCDALLGRFDSARLLDELVERNMFVTLTDRRSGRYRCHPLLRDHLTAELGRRLQPSERRARYRRAGQLLESAGAEPALRREALRAYAHAGDLWATARLTPASWSEVVEPARAGGDAAVQPPVRPAPERGAIPWKADALGRWGAAGHGGGPGRR
ncbi:hypothetical protein Psuf_060360 [Phytohabitans suffuscus]|uniref:AAA+ ATPase domain-containing protein n=1 Tax=Phytohabitans suffuscus TaxID=624315 RepID=A0A6F8YRV7_9ACTN|nr:AAA family ATPase [Phytohabitans suffuscus]BCB88723.1 hypothetical protein Psuf_060360 [Phytohabitans suffuscus]